MTTRRVPFIEQIFYRSKLIFALLRINVVRNGNEPYIVIGEKFLSIVKLRNKVSQLTGTLFDKICILFKESDVNYARTTNTS